MVALKAAEACLKRHARVTVLGRSEHIFEEGGAPARRRAHGNAPVDMQGVNLNWGRRSPKREPLPDGALGVRFGRRRERAHVHRSAASAWHDAEHRLHRRRRSRNRPRHRGRSLHAVQRPRASSPPGDVAQAPCLTGARHRGPLGRKRGRWRRRRAKAWPRTSAARPTVPKIASIRAFPANTIRVGRALFASAGHAPKTPCSKRRRSTARPAPLGSTRARVRSGAAFDAAPARCGALASDSATGNDAARPILKETGRRGVYTLKAYAPRADGSLALTGFNMVALADGRGLFDSAADDIGALRAEITRNAFQARTT